MVCAKKIEKISHAKVKKITSSFGVSQFQDDKDVELLIKRTDDALYDAKNSGRNCVKQG